MIDFNNRNKDVQTQSNRFICRMDTETYLKIRPQLRGHKVEAKGRNQNRKNQAPNKKIYNKFKVVLPLKNASYVTLYKKYNTGGKYSWPTTKDMTDVKKLVKRLYTLTMV